MSHGLPDLNPIIDAIPGRRVPMPAMAVGLGAIVVGIAGMGYGFATNPVWAWGAFLVGLIYVLGIAQGGVIFSVILTLTEARWGRPLKRISEAFGFFLPIGWLLLLVFLLLGNGIYSWTDTPFAGIEHVSVEPHSDFAYRTKPIWLNLPFFIARQGLGVGLLIALDFAFLYMTLRPDLIRAKARLGDRAPGWWSFIIGGGTDWKAAAKTLDNSGRILSVIVAMAYALIFSMVAFDLVMSLSPWWYANMFGAWFFASSVWLALCAVGVAGLLSREWLGLQHFIKPSVTHDLGKLALAFCMFWAYTGFAQLLPIWYGNMPEETDFFLVRLLLPEWAWLARTVGVMCFVIPFTVLISRGIKKMKWPFIGILAVVMLGIFFERTLLVMPSIWFESFPVVDFIIVSIGTWIGFMGLFFTVVSQALAQLPPVGVGDPYLEEHPWDVHVHSLDHAH